ncbi:uncharacterized protein (DUF2384 family) [Nocardioides ginsengisegetis]|uniref:Uncharacterized protein (DUF2384 family) n=1 Tax=Nocardioides ginsengisegetis TaxID=661491 RepID=A0A7W3PBI1_9ACTN|nr:antitoxin Xre/MbcA/ParS toxin-binding domain-containing protein [Nocardioides ginsengisegetis]MBA8805454.1 uncharacterized protein (DUF2384 family) [Nocardioides ginsengisegetis]
MPSSAHAERARSSDPQVARLIAKLKERGSLSAAEIGEIVGVGTRQVQNWATGHGAPANTKRLRQLLDLAYVLDLVSEVFDDEGATMWLHARNRQLDGERPLDLIAQHETDRVITLLDRLADGNF